MSYPLRARRINHARPISPLGRKGMEALRKKGKAHGLKSVTHHPMILGLRQRIKPPTDLGLVIGCLGCFIQKKKNIAGWRPYYDMAAAQLNPTLWPSGSLATPHRHDGILPRPSYSLRPYSQPSLLPEGRLPDGPVRLLEPCIRAESNNNRTNVRTA